MREQVPKNVEDGTPGERAFDGPRALSAADRVKTRVGGWAFTRSYVRTFSRPGREGAQVPSP